MGLSGGVRVGVLILLTKSQPPTLPRLEVLILFSVPPSPRVRVKGVVRLEIGRGANSLALREAYIPNLSLLVCLEAFEKFLVGEWWVVDGG